MKKYIPVLFILFLISCEMIVDIEVPFKKPQLVVNSFFNPDSVWSASVSLNRHILSDVPYVRVENALVVMYQSDSPIDTLVHQQGGFYKSKTNKPHIETEYEIRVSAEHVDAVRSISQVPTPAQISRVEIENGTTSANENNNSILNITFHDNAKEINYYQIMVEIEQEWYNPSTGTINTYRTSVEIESNDLITNNDNAYLIDGFVVKDILFNGKEVTLSFKTQYANLEDAGTLFISLRTLSEDCYQYKSTVQLQYETSGNPFAQPVNVTSNIENGFGIFAGYSQSTFTHANARPLITGISPSEGKIGDHVIISGKNLLGSYVSFSSSDYNVSAQTIRSSENEIEVIVPEGAITGRFIVHSNGGVVMSEFDFEVVD